MLGDRHNLCLKMTANLTQILNYKQHFHKELNYLKKTIECVDIFDNGGQIVSRLKKIKFSHIRPYNFKK